MTYVFEKKKSVSFHYFFAEDHGQEFIVGNVLHHCCHYVTCLLCNNISFSSVRSPVFCETKNERPLSLRVREIAIITRSTRAAALRHPTFADRNTCIKEEEEEVEKKKPLFLNDSYIIRIRSEHINRNLGRACIEDAQCSSKEKKWTEKNPLFNDRVKKKKVKTLHGFIILFNEVVQSVKKGRLFTWKIFSSFQ